MAKVSFVGFQEKVEIPEGFQLLKIDEELSTKKDRDSIYLLLSDPQQISQWFYQVQSFDSRPGGKFVFINGANESEEATCTSFVLGKEISLISQSLGNISAKIVKGKSENSIHLSFSILTDKSDIKSKEILELLQRLQRLL